MSVHGLDRPLPGEIHGTKWNDLDGDGVRDAGEPGLEAWTIFLDQNTNGVLDAGEPNTLTDVNGDYALTDLLGVAAGALISLDCRCQNRWKVRSLRAGDRPVLPEAVSDWSARPFLGTARECRELGPFSGAHSSVQPRMERP